jgi:hypothetical protein
MRSYMDGPQPLRNQDNCSAVQVCTNYEGRGKELTKVPTAKNLSATATATACLYLQVTRQSNRPVAGRLNSSVSASFGAHLRLL